MTKVLIYYSSNNRTVSIETQVMILQQLDCQVHFISQAPKGLLYNVLVNDLNVISPKEYPTPSSFWSKIRHLIFIIDYCRLNNIDLVFGHLQYANIFMVLASFFLKAKIVAFRHHFEAKNFKEYISDWLINSLAELVVVPSRTLYESILKERKAQKGKLTIIPYIYDFSGYAQPNLDEVRKIRNTYECQSLLLVASRMIKSKRHDLAIRMLKNLLDSNLDVKMILLDRGPEEDSYKKLASELGLSDKVFFVGFVDNLIDYLWACDILVHPSNNDVSSSLVKEAGYMSKAVVICRQAGDFDEYIEDEVNGMMCDIECQFVDMVTKTEKLVKDPELVIRLGENLKKTVESKFAFSSEKLSYYRDLLS